MDALAVIEGRLHGGEATEAVGDNVDAARRAGELAAQPRRPRRQVGVVPVVLHDANAIGELALEPSLPVVRPAAVQSGDDEGRIHAILVCLSVELGCADFLRYRPPDPSAGGRRTPLAGSVQPAAGSGSP